MMVFFNEAEAKVTSAFYLVCLNFYRLRVEVAPSPSSMEGVPWDGIRWWDQALD
jgi:hypothetical protein